MSLIVYFDCFSGISGDMTVGALLDLGMEFAYLQDALAGLKVGGYRLEASRQERKGVAGTDFRVIMSHHHHDHHVHRGLKEIEDIIGPSPLSEGVKQQSLQVFKVLAEAEARAHGCTVDQIHFHEVGAVDSIIDIVGACIGLEWLGDVKIQHSAVNTGGGMVECAHGMLPVPAPATLEALTGTPIYNSGVNMELATPTGAAILKALSQGYSPLPVMMPIRTGYGCGKRQLPHPNLLRVILGEEPSAEKRSGQDGCWMIEANIDDMNPEIYSYLFPLILDQGALDIFTSPIMMKKGRPANRLSVLCRESQLPDLEKIILTETTTLGLRKYPVERSELDREIRVFNSSFGPVEVKVASRDGQVLRAAPEFDVCQRLAREKQMPLINVYQAIMTEFGQSQTGRASDWLAAE